MTQAELDGAPDDSLGFNIPVGLSHYLAIDASGCPRCRGPVVLDSLLHHTQLLCREPAFKTGVLHQYLAAGDVVYSPRSRHSQVVIGGNSIDHVEIGANPASQFQRTADDTRGVLHVVRTVELGVLWQYLGLDEFYQI